MHNDGETRRIYAVKTTGRVAAQVRIPASVEDVEDIAIGPGPTAASDYVYLGDIGDNDGKRREVHVVRFAEPSLAGVGQAAEDHQVFRLAYPDGPHDAEALLVDSSSGDLFIATKEEDRTRVYRAARDRLQGAELVAMDLAATLKVGGVSAGDISADGSVMVLRREDQGWLWRRAEGESVGDALKREPQKIAVRGKKQGENGEAIALAPDGRSYYTVSEGKDERIYQFDVPE
jgi:hypothetical protein